MSPYKDPGDEMISDLLYQCEQKHFARFSSKAESHMFRLWGADVVNMTTVPEVVKYLTGAEFTKPHAGGAGQGGRTALCSHCDAHRL